MEELQDKINDLENRIKELEGIKAASTIPHEIEQAFRGRLRINSFVGASVASKSASSENQLVNEAGAGSYSVLKPPDGFIQISLSNTTYYFPYYG